MSGGMPKNSQDDRFKTRLCKILGMLGGLVGINVILWAVKLIAFHRFPLLLGTATLAYTFGLRHALDADHISRRSTTSPAS